MPLLASNSGTFPARAFGTRPARASAMTNSNYDIAMGMTCGLRNSLGWPAHSASWILNHKALAFAALAERSILARRPPIPTWPRLSRG